MNLIDIASQTLSDKRLHKILIIILSISVILTIIFIIMYAPGSYNNSQKEQKISESIKDNYIVKKLPYKSAFYSINYEYDKNYMPIITVDTSIPLQRKRALDWMKNAEPGSTAKYKIIFEDLKNNPFKENINE